MAGAAVRNVMVRVGADTRQLSRGMQQAQRTMQQAGARMKTVGIALGAAFATFATIGIKKAMDAYGEFSSATMGLQSFLEAQGKSFDEANKFIQDYIKDGLVPATNAIQAYKMLLARGYDDTQIQDIMNRLKDSAAFNRQSHLTMGEAIQGASEGLKNENSILVDNAGVTKNVSQMWADYARQIGVGEMSLTTAQKRQAEYNGIMQETRFQVGDAAKYTTTYAGRVAQFNQVLYRLQVAWGAAFAKIAEVVIPLLIQLGETLIQVGNTFTQFISALTGQAVQQKAVTDTAKTAVKSEVALGKAVGTAGKKAKGAVAGFDEINELQEKMADSGSGATDGITDIASSFDKVGSPTVDTGNNQFNEFTEKIKNSIQSLSPYWELLKNNFEDAMKVFIPVMKPVIEFFANVFGKGIEVILKDLLFLFSMFLKGIEVIFGGWKKLIDTDWVQVWNNIKTFTQQMLSGIGQFFVNAFAWISNTIQSSIIFMTQILNNGLKAISDFIQLTLSGIGWFFVNAWTWISNTVNNSLASISTALTNAWNNMSNLTKSIWNGIGTWWKEFWNGILINFGVFWSNINTSFNTYKTAFQAGWSNLWNGVKTTTENIWKGIWDSVKGFINLIIGGINQIIKAWNSLKFELPEKKFEVLGQKMSIGGFKLQTPQMVEIPKLANGGIVNGATTFMAGEAGAEAIVPLQNSDFIKQFANEIANAMGGTGKEVVISVDGVKLARAIMPAMRNETSRIGNTSIIQTV